MTARLNIEYYQLGNLMVEVNEMNFFAEESEEKLLQPEKAHPPWKALVVDDEEEVHHLTNLVLRDFCFEHRKLEFVHAYSAKEAWDKIQEHPDIAFILLDVVMESDDAGLQLVKRIRDELKNNLVRIVLRTGQPGQAPADRVILNYDINDYKSKSELTSGALFITTVAALRAYQDLSRIALSKEGLMKIIDASSSLFNLQSLQTFISGILTQLSGLLPLSDPSVVLSYSGIAANAKNGGYMVLAGTGEFSHLAGHLMDVHDNQAIFNLVDKAYKQKKSMYEGDSCAVFIEDESKQHYFVIYLDGYTYVDEWERKLLDIFSRNLAIAYKNAKDYSHLQHCQQQVREETLGLQKQLSELHTHINQKDPTPELIRFCEEAEQHLNEIRCYLTEKP